MIMWPEILFWLYVAMAFFILHAVTPGTIKHCRECPDLAHEFIGLALFSWILWPYIFVGGIFTDGPLDGRWVWKTGYAATALALCAGIAVGVLV